MAGYNWNRGKSNNAVNAESNGLMTATTMAKYLKKWFSGITSKNIKAIMSPSEWHHTSKFYNETDYYDLRDLADLSTRKALRNDIANKKELSKLFDKADKDKFGRAIVYIPGTKDIWRFFDKKDIATCDPAEMIKRLEGRA
jgi:hypothetical protein